MSNKYSFNGEKLVAPRKGELLNKYTPLLNLVDDNGGLKPFNTDKLSVDGNHPLQMDVVPEYDGSVNIIINDDEHQPRLINSRFSVRENNLFSIPDRVGDKDTSFYQDSCIELDTSLYKYSHTIPKLEFNGLRLDGRLLCGAYTFYFTLADDDDNETDFIEESGVVMVHMGNINDPSSIRMGLENERTDKSVSFTLSNLDESYSYVCVYYARTTSDDSQSDQKSYFKLVNKIPIDKDNYVNIDIYGIEELVQIPPTDLVPQYNIYQKAKTQAICGSRLFLGNVDNDFIDYEQFKRESLKFVPSFETGDSIGQLKYNYNDNSYDNEFRFGYYNAKNIYYRTGYWPGEYYRFGIVYIMKDGTTSQVFDILGVDCEQLGKASDIKIKNTDYFSEEGYLIRDGIEDRNYNKFGITRSQKGDQAEMLTERGHPLCVKIQYTGDNSDFFKNKCLGYFFVRQQRNPITVAQGVVIGKTDHNHGDWPVLQNAKGKYFTESFLSRTVDDKDPELNKKSVLRQGYVYPDAGVVQNKAVIVPEANLREHIFNDLFSKRDFHLERVGTVTQFSSVGNNKLIIPKLIANKKGEQKKSKVTQVNTGIKLITDGENFFSSMSGVDVDITHFKSVTRDWMHEGRKPKQLIASAIGSIDRSNDIIFELTKDLLIRGYSGSYTGISSNEFEYGDIVSIKDSRFNEDESSYRLKVEQIKNQQQPYFSISQRYSYDNITPKKCYRGDCYICNVTQRMSRNFIDPDLPLTNRIIDIDAWENNFMVITKGSSVSEGKVIYVNEVLNEFKTRYFWYAQFGSWGNLYFTQCRRWSKIEGNSPDVDNKVDLTACRENLLEVAILTKVLNLLSGFITSVLKRAAANEDLSEGTDFTNIVFHVDKSAQIVKKGKIFDNPIMSVKIPGDAKYEKCGNALEILGIPNPWETRGIHKINRSDVNNVQLGHWFTVRVLSNYNLNMRDIDPYHTQEKALFNAERSFYPLRPLSRDNQFKMAESNVINGACNVYMPERPYVRPKEVPFIKQEYETRIAYSNVDTEGSFKNGYRYFNVGQYCDYDKQYGGITKLISYGTSLFVVMEHGILLVPINERVLTGAGTGGGVYVNSDTVISNRPVVVSETYGSMWIDSVIKSPYTNRVFGIDTSAKKIWMYDGNALQCISDMKLGRYLNENIDLSEWDKFFELGITNAKSHYNASKSEVIFTFYHNEKQWNICFSEQSQAFSTFYTWTPSYSENINNVFFSFDLEDTRNLTIEPFVEWIGIKPTGTTTDFTYSLDKQIVMSKERFEHLKKQDDYINILVNSHCICPVKLSNKFDTSDLQYFTITDNNVKVSSVESNNVVVLTISGTRNVKLTELIDKKFLKLYFTNQEDTWGVRIPLSKNPVKIWKHSQFGNYEGQGTIKPTNWYDKQEPFEVEFVVNENAQVQKLFNNLWFISNRVKPDELLMEIDGDSYDFFKFKKIIQWANDRSENEDELRMHYIDLLTLNQGLLKLLYDNYPKPDWCADSYVFKTVPYIKTIIKDSDGKEINKFSANLTDMVLVYDKLMNLNRVRVTLKCNDVAEVGRVAGNTQYIEDNYYIELRNMTIRDAYLDNSGLLRYKNTSYPKVRDKYMKIRVKYSGKDLVVLQLINAFFDYSYA